MSEAHTAAREQAIVTREHATVMADSWPVPEARPFGPLTYDNADSLEDRWFKFALKLSIVVSVITLECIVLAALAFVIWGAAR